MHTVLSLSVKNQKSATCNKLLLWEKIGNTSHETYVRDYSQTHSDLILQGLNTLLNSTTIIQTEISHLVIYARAHIHTHTHTHTHTPHSPQTVAGET